MAEGLSYNINVSAKGLERAVETMEKGAKAADAATESAKALNAALLKNANTTAKGFETFSSVPLENIKALKEELERAFKSSGIESFVRGALKPFQELKQLHGKISILDEHTAENLAKAKLDLVKINESARVLYETGKLDAQAFGNVAIAVKKARVESEAYTKSAAMDIEQSKQKKKATEDLARATVRLNRLKAEETANDEKRLAKKNAEIKVIETLMEREAKALAQQRQLNNTKLRSTLKNITATEELNKIKQKNLELEARIANFSERNVVRNRKLANSLDLLVAKEKEIHKLELEKAKAQARNTEEAKKLQAEIEALTASERKRLELQKQEEKLARDLVKARNEQANQLKILKARSDAYNQSMQKQIVAMEQKFKISQLQARISNVAGEKRILQEEAALKRLLTTEKLHLDQQQRLIVAREKASASYIKQEKEIARLEERYRRAINAVNKFNLIQSKGGIIVSSFRNVMDAMGRHIAVYTAGMVGLSAAIYGSIRTVRNAMTNYNQFGESMARVRAVTGATTEEMTALSEEASRLGRTTRFTAVEAAQGLVQLGMAGLSATESMQALEPVLQLTSIGALSFAEAADIATNIMRGFNLTAGELPHVVDVMALAVTSANMTVQQLGNALSYAAPIASSFGVSLEDVAAAMEVLHNSGIKASRAGTSMRRIMLSLYAPTTKGVKALDSLGVAIEDITGKTRPFLDILEDLHKAVKDDSSQLYKLTEIVGVRASPAFIQLVKASDGSITSLKNLAEVLRSATGEAKTMQETIEDFIGADWEKLISVLVDIGNRLIDVFGDNLRSVIQDTTKALQGFASNDDAIKSLASSIGKVGSAVKTFAEVFITYKLIQLFVDLGVRTREWGVYLVALNDRLVNVAKGLFKFVSGAKAVEMATFSSAKGLIAVEGAAAASAVKITKSAKIIGKLTSGLKTIGKFALKAGTSLSGIGLAAWAAWEAFDYLSDKLFNTSEVSKHLSKAVSESEKALSEYTHTSKAMADSLSLTSDREKAFISVLEREAVALKAVKEAREQLAETQKEASDLEEARSVVAKVLGEDSAAYESLTKKILAVQVRAEIEQQKAAKETIALQDAKIEKNKKMVVELENMIQKWALARTAIEKFARNAKAAGDSAKFDNFIQALERIDNMLTYLNNKLALLKRSLNIKVESKSELEDKEAVGGAVAKAKELREHMEKVDTALARGALSARAMQQQYQEVIDLLEKQTPEAIKKAFEITGTKTPTALKQWLEDAKKDYERVAEAAKGEREEIEKNNQLLDQRAAKIAELIGYYGKEEELLARKTAAEEKLKDIKTELIALLDKQAATGKLEASEIRRLKFLESEYKSTQTLIKSTDRLIEKRENLALKLEDQLSKATTLLDVTNEEISLKQRQENALERESKAREGLVKLMDDYNKGLVDDEDMVKKLTKAVSKLEREQRKRIRLETDMEKIRKKNNKEIEAAIKLGKKYTGELQYINEELAKFAERLDSSIIEQGKFNLEVIQMNKLLQESPQYLDAVTEHLRQMYNEVQAAGKFGFEKTLYEWADATDELRDATSDWLEDFADKLADFITTGKADFRGFVDDIIHKLAELASQQFIVNIAAALGFGPGVGNNPYAAGGGSLFGTITNQATSIATNNVLSGVINPVIDWGKSLFGFGSSAAAAPAVDFLSAPYLGYGGTGAEAVSVTTGAGMNEFIFGAKAAGAGATGGSFLSSMTAFFTNPATLAMIAIAALPLIFNGFHDKEATSRFILKTRPKDWEPEGTRAKQWTGFDSSDVNRMIDPDNGLLKAAAVKTLFGTLIAGGQHFGQDEQMSDEDRAKYVEEMIKLFQQIGELDQSIVDAFDVTDKTVDEIAKRISSIDDEVKNLKTPDIGQFLIDRYSLIFEEVDSTMSTLFDSITTGLMSPEDAMLAVQTTLQIGQAIHTLGNIGSIVEEDLKNLSKTEQERLRDLYVSTSKVISAYDGSLKSAKDMADALGSFSSATANFLANIEAIREGLSTAFSNTREKIVTDLMSDSEKFDYYKEKADDLSKAISITTDPHKIEKMAAQLDSYINKTWEIQMRQGEDAAKQAKQAYLDYLDDVEDMVNRQLDKAKTEAELSAQAIADKVAEAINDPANIIKDAADTMSDAADNMGNAADKMKYVITTFNTNNEPANSVFWNEIS